MGKIHVPFFAVLFVFISHMGFGDIVVTTDDMILNGKIIEDIKDDHVKLANYHGIFTIKYPQIKEMHKTGNYQEDVNIFKKLGRAVDENEIKTNYQAGIEKLKGGEIEGRNAEEKKAAASSIRVLLLLSPFFNMNMGKLRYALPYSSGATVSGEILFQRTYSFLPGGISVDLQYFHSEKKNKQGLRLPFQHRNRMENSPESPRLFLQPVPDPGLGGRLLHGKGKARENR